jgi:hypothetical protein
MHPLRPISRSTVGLDHNDVVERPDPEGAAWQITVTAATNRRDCWGR